LARLVFWICTRLRLFALDCAYLRPKLRPCFLLQIALRYWTCSLFLILITILDIYARMPPKYRVAKNNVRVDDPGCIHIYIYIIYILYTYNYIYIYMCIISYIRLTMWRIIIALLGHIVEWNPHVCSPNLLVWCISTNLPGPSICTAASFVFSYAFRPGTPVRESYRMGFSALSRRFSPTKKSHEYRHYWSFKVVPPTVMFVGL